ncbi:MAG: NAD(P)H-hydrate dehydratase [Bacteroidales bacterium]|nr:NAD(P)H-hydrate dehydratase [Bacteroidales bacterium]
MNRIDPAYLRTRLLQRSEESHKGDYGHLLVVAGCQTMPGAAVLATGAALRSGCGLVTLHSTSRALQAVVVRCPSAMLSEEAGEAFSRVPVPMDRYTAIAVGPGLGRRPETAEALLLLLDVARQRHIPTVLDADALNILSELNHWPDCLPAGAVLTPHLGELRRLLPFGSDAERDRRVRALCAGAGCTLVMKGFHTKVYTPDGDCLVNATGNPGLAKGGSGDVLTGLLGGLLARGYAAPDAAALAVWLHGRAGDLLTEERTAEAYASLDLVDHLYRGFKELYDGRA